MTGFPRYDAGYKEMLEYEALRKYQLSLTAFTEGT